MGSKFSAGVVLGALSGLLASPFDLVRIRPVKAETGQKRITIGGECGWEALLQTYYVFPGMRGSHAAKFYVYSNVFNLFF